jgi:putative heme iron utilization protein
MVDGRAMAFANRRPGTRRLRPLRTAPSARSWDDPSVTDTADHGVPAGEAPPAPPGPLAPADDAPRRRSAAEEARTILARTNQGTLATLSADGHPWASFVTYGTLADGSPVLCLSTLAEHGRNLQADARASLAVAIPPASDDPLDTGRITLAGRAEVTDGDDADEARAAHLAAVPGAHTYIDYGDFTLWVLRVERVRWVGGYGRMASADAAAYAAAEPDPVAGSALDAVAHLNDDHAEALVAMARALAGYTDATSARCTAADRYGLDLVVQTPRGRAQTRVAFAEPIGVANGLRPATVELARRARGG